MKGTVVLKQILTLRLERERLAAFGGSPKGVAKLAIQ